jgi:hypothetical protein
VLIPTPAKPNTEKVVVMGTTPTQYHVAVAPVYDPLLAGAEAELEQLSKGRPVAVVRPENELTWLRELLDDDVKLETAYAQIQAQRKHSAARGTAVPIIQRTQPAVPKLILRPATPGADQLTLATDSVRETLADRSQPTKMRAHLLWAAAKAARDLGAADVVYNAFIALAVETNLINKHRQWTGIDICEHLRRYGAEDVAHVLGWAMRGRNPFAKGSLR